MSLEKVWNRNLDIQRQGLYKKTMVSIKLDERISKRWAQPKKKTIKKVEKRGHYSINKLNQNQIKEIFRNIDAAIISRKFAFSGKDGCFPKNITYALYRQNIKNYNPYIGALQQLQQQKITCLQKEYITNLCYLGLAKSYLKNKKYYKEPTYSRVNVLIRTYMREKMCSEIKEKEEKQDSIIYIPTNKLALSFNPNNYPVLLDQICNQQSFKAVINHVNRIIETEFVRLKKDNIIQNSESLAGKMIMAICTILSLIFALKKYSVIILLVFMFLIIWIVVSSMECHSKLQKFVKAKNVTTSIIEKINSFFESIKTERVEWKTGPDFYWLEIHYIKKKKKQYHT